MAVRFLVLVTALGLSASAAWADHEQEQGRTHKWWQSSTFKTELGLTPHQADELDAIYQASLPKLKSQKEELDRLEATLSKMIEDGTADEARVVQKLDRVEAARSELAKTRTLMLYRMHRVLTSDQRQKLKTLFERRDGDRDRKRPWE